MAEKIAQENCIAFELNGKTHQAKRGTTIIEAADALGVYIPRFCYFPEQLSRPANCRMCLIEVEGSNKPLPACITEVSDGMKIQTQSSITLKAQRSVMEFLLINHPLDCPICDQGGECELQDLAMGYGNSVSRFTESKRAVPDEDLGPLIATEMTRCIHCTRCVRFGEEIAGIPELGAVGRGQGMRITTYLKRGVQSELSGNIIDLCPVGALTSKPFRFKGRSWNFKAHQAISPHDCIGSNMDVHSVNRGYGRHEVMRVVPRKNNDLNTVWLSDRDRFSYQALHSKTRLTKPMIKKNGRFHPITWSDALHIVVEAMKQLDHKKDMAAYAHPSATLEEHFMMQQWFRSMGCHQLDHRITQQDFTYQEAMPTQPNLGGLTFEQVEQLDHLVLLGSDIRREQPMAAFWVRRAALKGCTVAHIHHRALDNHYPSTDFIVGPDALCSLLAGTLQLVLKDKSTHKLPKTTLDWLKKQSIKPSEDAKNLASSLHTKKKTALWLGPSALHHPQAGLIHALCAALSELTGATLGSLPLGANAAGASLVGMLPHRLPFGHPDKKASQAKQAKGLFDQAKRYYWLHGIEPEYDVANPTQALNALKKADFVVMAHAFYDESMLAYADLLLPLAPCYEQSGTLINILGHWAQQKAATQPQGQAKPGWQLYKVLANLMEMDGFDFSDLPALQKHLEKQFHLNKSKMHAGDYDQVDLSDETLPKAGALQRVGSFPSVRVDAIARRAPALQSTLSTEEQMIYMHPNTAKQHRVAAGEPLCFSQENTHFIAEVCLDERLAENTVCFPAALPMEPLGAIMGPISVKAVKAASSSKKRKGDV